MHTAEQKHLLYLKTPENILYHSFFDVLLTFARAAHENRRRIFLTWHASLRISGRFLQKMAVFPKLDFSDIFSIIRK